MQVREAISNMLYVTISEPDNLIKEVEGYFKFEKDKSWFNIPMVKEIIKGIDNTIAVKDEYLESPVFGGMSPDRLSTGCKAVILMLVQDRPVYATKCGDNCSPYILKIAEKKDITICLHHCLLGWGSDVNAVFDATFIETGVITHNEREFVDEYYRIRNKEY